MRLYDSGSMDTQGQMDLAVDLNRSLQALYQYLLQKQVYGEHRRIRAV